MQRYPNINALPVFSLKCGGLCFFILHGDIFRFAESARAWYSPTIVACVVLRDL